MFISQFIKILLYPGVIIPFIVLVIVPRPWFQKLKPFLKIGLGLISGLCVTTLFQYASCMDKELPIFVPIAFTIFLVLWTWYWIVKRQAFVKQ